jgi:hypothetical protein
LREGKLAFWFELLSPELFPRLAGVKEIYSYALVKWRNEYLIVFEIDYHIRENLEL